jgi:hypothetical protein
VVLTARPVSSPGTLSVRGFDLAMIFGAVVVVVAAFAV